MKSVFNNCFQTFIINPLNIFKRHFSHKTDDKIMKYLNVAEKNDAAKNIAYFLSRGSSQMREGISRYNKIYEFSSQVFGEPARMVMTSVSGHLLNYEFGGVYKNWQSCNPIALFDAPIIKTCHEDYQPIKRTLEREIVSCQGLIIWTDCDREGENIGFEVIKVCTDVKPHLRIYRAKFSEITAASVFRALNNLGQPNKNVSDAVDVRQELDLRTGAAFTRLQTLRLQKVFPQKLSDKVISYGSCQFPTLGFVVERYQAIENFIPEPFWKIKMNHTVNEITTEFTWARDRLFDKPAVEAILDLCQENPTTKVESVDGKEKSKWRPLPLDTVEMEKTVSRKLRINAKETMRIAERLYTQGYISYPRTETNIFPKELNLTSLVEKQNNDPTWGAFANRILNEGGPTPRQGKKSDQAHPPIHPTKYANNLTGNEQRLYEYIVRHFLACLHKDARGFETTVCVDCAGEKFKAKGLIILEKNYLDVYIYEKWNAKEINNYRVGDTFVPTVLDIVESSTCPPKLLTEADLIALMEKHGIGTDATHAEHIDKIKSREYVGLHENIYFVPGTLGMGLVEGYNTMDLEVSLAKPLLRAQFENDLKLICDGMKDPEVVRLEQIENYRNLFRTVMEKMRLLDGTLANRLADQPQPVAENDIERQPEFKPVLKCPKCGNDMVIRNKRSGPGKMLSCCGFPNCKNAVWFPGEVENIEVTNESCPECGPNCKKLKIKFKTNLFLGEPNPNVLCIGGCDINVLETFDISISSVRKPVNNTTVSNTSTQVTRNNNVNSSRSFLSNQSRTNSPQSQFARPNNNTTLPRPNNNTMLPRPNNNTTFLPNPQNTTQNNQNDFRNVPGPSSSNRTSVGNNEDEIICSCNVQAVLLTVRKEGPNQGRQFYKCANGTCNFFLWAGDGNTSVTSASALPTLPVNDGNDNSGEVQCNCRQPAVKKTVMKVGPNTGREFYTCPKGMGQGCNFFKWADQNDGGDMGRAGGSGYAGRPSGGGGDGGGSGSTWSKKKKTAPYKKPKTGGGEGKKCGVCRQTGHTKRNCPNK